MFANCTICFDVLTAESKVSSTYCGHLFHTKCIETWLREKNECPQCRAHCDIQKIHPIFLSEISTESLLMPRILLLSAKRGYKDVYESVIVEAEVKNPKDSEDEEGRTCLHYAASKGHWQICKLIVDAIEDKHPKDSYGRTPLHSAAKDGHEEVCKLIIDSVKARMAQDMDRTLTLILLTLKVHRIL